MPHPQNVRKRIKQLKDYINVTPGKSISLSIHKDLHYYAIDWICYGLLDDITDSFAPLIRAIEFEVDSIDELVLILKESEQSDMLRRIGYCRKRMMGLLRLLSSKTDVVKTLIKRGEMVPEEGTRPALSKEVALYLGDVQGNDDVFCSI
jgi:magnesium transporter